MNHRAQLTALATHLPDGVMTNADLEAIVETSDTWIMERTGIRTRHKVGSGETSATMGTDAARRALAAAGNPQVDAVICATCTPDTLVPSAASLIHRNLELPPCPVFDLNAACSGFVYASIVANSLIASGSATTVLVVASEALTRLVDYNDRSTCVLFGDGAGAAVFTAGDGGGICAARWGADGSQADLIYYGPADEDPDSPDGFRMFGKGTYKLAVDRLCAMAVQLAEEAGWDPTEVDHFVPHQANLRIIEAAAKRVGIPMEKVIINVDRTGNTSAASIPLALGDAAAEGKLRPGDKIICVTFGAGATWGGFALEWTAAATDQPTVRATADALRQ
jgi:3-oxoacyl-[acyl-carrier-protein] synthase-3